MLVLYDISQSLPSLEFNDKLSSFIITGGRWTLYEHTNYNSRSVTFTTGQYTISSLSGAGGMIKSALSRRFNDGMVNGIIQN